MSMSEIDYEALGSGMGRGLNPQKKAKALNLIAAKYSRAMWNELERAGITPSGDDVTFIVDFLGEYLRKWHVLDEIDGP